VGLRQSSRRKDAGEDSEAWRNLGYSNIPSAFLHYDGGMEPSFNNAPIYLHELNRRWVMRPDPSIRFWSGDVKKLMWRLTLIKTGGHLDGFQVMHWSGSIDVKGVLMAGDQPDVCADRSRVTFM